MQHLQHDDLPQPDTGPDSLPGSEGAPVRVVLVEAVPAMRRLLLELLGADPRLRVVADFADPLAVAGFLQHERADVVLMDQDAPGDSALEGCRRIMESHPLPIVLCSAAVGAREAAVRAPEVGSVAGIDKPQPGDSTVLAARAAHMRQTLRLMSEVKVVRRWGRPPGNAAGLPGARTGAAAPREGSGRPPLKIIGIGASTGGPPVLQAVLSELPADFAVPILVVQHIATGFLPGMVQWLRQSSGPQVEIAAHGVVPQPGHVYLGPDDCQMGMGSAGRIVTSRLPSSSGSQQPSVAFLFRTLADQYGAQAAGVMLSGMGKDGAQELKRMRDLGATTIAQDRETSVVYGMPGEAIALGGATHVLPANRIAGALRALVPSRRNEGT